ncbi:hypothetical protein E2C01_058786 [Portunus trituberculatus]|uniref:Uncharacterized protein n=1 Tax=Portunus trituberculatus TaxID=210409 RepID=A0A5B7H446_PORTR|nr:hypothetical protein [Portunus trituberculatus]
MEQRRQWSLRKREESVNVEMKCGMVADWRYSHCHHAHLHTATTSCRLKPLTFSDGHSSLQTRSLCTISHCGTHLITLHTNTLAPRRSHLEFAAD